MLNKIHNQLNSCRYSSAIPVHSGFSPFGAAIWRLVLFRHSASGRRALRAMLTAHHPRGAPRHPGAGLCYWIHSAHLGRIGGLTFHLASWHQAARDGYVGGCDRARVANLRRVVNNSRFLLLPGVRVPNLASHVLGQVTVRLADDWAAAHGVRPVLAYSYVNAAQRGSCYAAAGWEMAGRVSGVYAGAEVGPMVWMRPLEAAWRRRLCQRPAGDPCWMTAPPLARAAEAAKDGDWQAREFGMLSHPDGCIRKRIRAMAAHWETRPGEPVAVVFPGRKEQKAAYRLLSNPRVTMDDILESHRAATLQRCRDETVVLAIQETTMLDSSPLQDATGGLARLGGGGTGSHGIPAHVTLAMSTSGRMLGLLDINADFRDGVTGETDGPRRTGDPQTDAGSALAVRPPKSPKMNGAACRMPATWRHEFDTVQDTATLITERNPRIDTHLDLDNGWKPHDARDDQTPNEDCESLQTHEKPASHMS